MVVLVARRSNDGRVCLIGNWMAGPRDRYY